MSFAMNVAAAYFIGAQRRPPIESAAIAKRLWSIGFTIIAFGGLLVAMRGYIPDLISIVLGEIMAIGGFGVTILGTRVFFGGTVRWWPVVTVAAFIGLSMLWWGFVDADGKMRVLALGLAGIVLCGWLVVSLRPWISARVIGDWTRIPGGIIAGGFALTIVAALVPVMRGPDFTDYLQSDGLVTITMALLRVVTMIFALWSLSLLTGKLGSSLRRELKSRDRLISILAHDLRTPFNSLVGGTDALQHFVKAGDMEKASRTAENVHEASGQALALVDSLLAWVRIQIAGSQRGPVSLAESCHAAFEPLQRSFAQKDIALERSIDPSVSAIAEQGGVETILRNLLSNALKFSSPGSQVGLCVAQEGDRAVLIVRDQGTGMDAEILQRINDPEKRHTSSGTSGEKGNGFGLIFCRDLVHSYRGTLSIQSAPGEGTTVRVDLPAGPVLRAEPDHAIAA